MNVLLLHAYSRKNAGDGLLVDLSEQVAAESLGQVNVRVVALDADSFGDAAKFVPLLTGGDTSRARVVAGLRLLLGRGRDAKRLREQLEWADVLLAVGGGYLRASRLRESLATGLTHLPQMRMAAASGLPLIYLPQSVGPLSGLVGSAVIRALRAASLTVLRDDKSLQELRYRLPQSNALRTPDLVIMSLVDSTFTPVEKSLLGDRLAVVARDLGDSLYDRNLCSTVGRIEASDWLVQSRGRGNDDVAYYERLGKEPKDDLLNGLASLQYGAVLSVRLHGALQSIAAGVPAVHLSYERKGQAAYADLGLDRYVFDARNFSTAEVELAVNEVMNDPSEYWECVTRSLPAVAASRQSLVHALREVTDLST